MIKYILPFTNIYHGVGEVWNPHYWSHAIASDHNYVPSNDNGDCETIKVLLNCFLCYEQSDWLEKVITIFIISFIYSCRMWSFVDFPLSSDLPRYDKSVKGSMRYIWY